MDRDQRAARHAFDQDVRTARTRDRSPEKKGHQRSNTRTTPAKGNGGVDFQKHGNIPDVFSTPGRGPNVAGFPSRTPVSRDTTAYTVRNDRNEQLMYEPDARQFRKTQEDTQYLSQQVRKNFPLPYHTSQQLYAQDTGDERGDEYFMSGRSAHAVPQIPDIYLKKSTAGQATLSSPIKNLPLADEKKFPWSVEPIRGYATPSNKLTGRTTAKTPKPPNIYDSESSPEKESLADRRMVVTPANLDVDATRVHLKQSAERKGPQKPIIVQKPTIAQMPPAEETDSDPPASQESGDWPKPLGCEDEEDSSVYSSYSNPMSWSAIEPRYSPSILRHYSNWQYMPMENRPGLESGPTSSVSAVEQKPTTHRRGQSENPSTTLASALLAPATGPPEPAYSPLTPFFQTVDGPAKRKAAKTLVGDNGWLEKTEKTDLIKKAEEEKLQPTSSPQRKKGWMENLVKKAKEKMGEMSGDKSSLRKTREEARDVRGLAISLSPREQSLVYCELEYTLTTALSAYIQGQLNAGRLDADKLRRIADAWSARGMPRVLGFRFDLETQLDLVRLHVNEFLFYPAPEASLITRNSRPSAAAAVLGVVDMMKTDARIMRVRTFCSPDTVIAKQLVDAQALFTLVGADQTMHFQINEIIAFFQAAVTRERHLATRREAGDKPKADEPKNGPVKNTATQADKGTNGEGVVGNGGRDSAGRDNADRDQERRRRPTAVQETPKTPKTPKKKKADSRIPLSRSNGNGPKKHQQHAGTVAAPALRTQRSNGLARWNTDNPRRAAQRAAAADTQDRMDPADYDDEDEWSEEE